MEDNDFLAIAATSSIEHALEMEQNRGQLWMLNSPVLPTQITDGGKEALEKVGVKFTGPLEDDELFQRVELPNGWTKQPTDHALHAHLVDDKGRERGHIWYKPSSYDRKAGLNVYTRFEYECDYESEYRQYYVIDRSTKTRVYESAKVDKLPYNASQQTRNEYKQAMNSIRSECIEWLSTQYPQWKDSAAYWD